MILYIALTLHYATKGSLHDDFTTRKQSLYIDNWASQCHYLIVFSKVHHLAYCKYTTLKNNLYLSHTWLGRAVIFWKKLFQKNENLLEDLLETMHKWKKKGGHVPSEHSKSNCNSNYDSCEMWWQWSQNAKQNMVWKVMEWQWNSNENQRYRFKCPYVQFSNSHLANVWSSKW